MTKAQSIKTNIKLILFKLLINVLDLFSCNIETYLFIYLFIVLLLFSHTFFIITTDMRVLFFSMFVNDRASHKQNTRLNEIQSSLPTKDLYK